MTDIKKPYLYSQTILNRIYFISYRLRKFKKINFFDLYEAGLSSSLKFMMPLLEDGRLSKYVIASSSEIGNQKGLNIFKSFISSKGFKADYNSFLANFNLQNHYQDVKSLITPNKDTANLFFLGESVLGNHLRPQVLLKNIYDSMLLEDFLIISQDI